MGATGNQEPLPTRGDERSWLERIVHRAYTRFVIPHVADDLSRQRLKMLWYAWGYWRILLRAPLPVRIRVRLIRDFLRVDFNVLHGHSPSEMAFISCALAERPGQRGEALVEAGCWKGGSSAKFSILCAALGYQLHIYDSFQGVETLPLEERAKEWDYAGRYASPEDVLLDNLRRYGRPENCTVHKGWFSETIGRAPVPFSVRLGYIDCDLAKATLQALAGIVPSLGPDGLIFSQDFHIAPVRNLLLDADTWARFGKAAPSITRLGRRLARIQLALG